ncbi:hypothetical protein Bca52824_095143 [Brassica carinata]|uniref:Uncharacterized protein n=1 Tax=Brassica carinata TaxID=52824 RepID=A0A8X7P299_BRACI|nr:hypothetical protein Bca52824_095143 [Brassica carinata]
MNITGHIDLGRVLRGRRPEVMGKTRCEVEASKITTADSFGAIVLVVPLIDCTMGMIRLQG